MSKFVRQSVYGWQQFRDDIKKETYMFEGKEYLGWDLPMHEQMRLFRIAEARIVEVANYANFSDNNPTSLPSIGAFDIILWYIVANLTKLSSFLIPASINSFIMGPTTAISSIP